MEKILITGAGGYIGSNLLPALDKSNYELHLFSHSSSNQDINTYSVDITNHSSVDAAITKIKPDIIVHLAASGFNYTTAPSLDDLIKINFLATKNLVDVSSRFVSKFIYTTTYMECQGSEQAITPNDILQPQSDYALSKSLSTNLLLSFSKVHNFNPVVLRFFSVYGKNDLKFRFIPSVFDALLNNKILETTSLKQKRDFVYIKDVANALVKAIQTKKTKQVIYNIGSGHPTPLIEVVKKIKELCPDSRGQIKIGTKPDRPNEGPCYFSDISDTIRDLHWKPQYDLKEGFKETKTFLTQ